MSFILDALKKSEAERRQKTGPALLEMRLVAPQRRLPAWAIIVGVLLVGNALVLGWLALRPTPSTPAEAASDPATTGRAPANVSAGQSGNQTAIIAAPSLAAAAIAPANAPPAAPANPAGTAGSGTTASTPPASAAPSAPGDSDGNPADLEPAQAPASGTAGGTREASPRSYAELSGVLPVLRLDLHVFSGNPAERYAFINMHKVREGDVTPEGLRVLQITHDGVVLDFRGTEFLLGRQ
jgi:general secretion pathway protein B